MQTVAVVLGRLLLLVGVVGLYLFAASLQPGVLAAIANAIKSLP